MRLRPHRPTSPGARVALASAIVLLLVLGVVLWAVRGSRFATSGQAPEVKRILVISDSLSEGMGEVSDIGRTWPQVMARSLRREYGLEPLTGGSWIPAGLNGSGFTFTAGRAGSGASSATEAIGIPGSMRGGPITFSVDGYESVLVTVNATRPGVTFTVRSGSTTTSHTVDRAGAGQFRVPVTDGTVEVTPGDVDGQVLGVLAESGEPGSGTSVYNLSWSGSSTTDWVRWVEKGGFVDLVRQIDPDLIILSLGGNDYWADGDTGRFESHLRRIHDGVAAAAPDARWILGTQPVPAKESPGEWRAFQDTTVRYAEELGAPVLDLADDMPTVIEDGLLYSADGTHLTDAGHAWIAGLAVLAVHELD